jgi:hypothetical protein
MNKAKHVSNPKGGELAWYKNQEIVRMLRLSDRNDRLLCCAGVFELAYGDSRLHFLIEPAEWRLP